jgi:hypothetical protein
LQGADSAQLTATVWRLTWKNAAVERLAAWAVHELEAATAALDASTARGKRGAILHALGARNVCGLTHWVVGSLLARCVA